jgi:hypothetical protein
LDGTGLAGVDAQPPGAAQASMTNAASAALQRQCTRIGMPVPPMVD